jgi:hypothetical protein
MIGAFIGSPIGGEILNSSGTVVGQTRAARYFPPRSVTRPMTALIREVDPEWRAPMTGREVEFVFSNGRSFTANRSQRHPYDIED